MPSPPTSGAILYGMTPEELERHADTLAVINNELSSRLDRQSDSLNAIDTKAGLVIGYTLAAASFLATRHAQPVLVGLAYAAYALAAGLGVAALAVWNFREIEPRPLLRYANRSAAATYAALMATRVQVFDTNQRRQKRKARQWWLSLAAVLAGTILMVSAILVQTYEHDRAEPGRQPAAARHAEHPRRQASPAASTG
jgi:uncharacterized membrane protein